MHADLSPTDKSPSAFVTIAALLLTAIGIYFGTGLRPLWWLTWLAPMPVFIYAIRARPLHAALVAGIAMMLGNLNQWHYLARDLHLPAPIAILTLLLPAIAFAIAALLLRVMPRRGALAAMLVAPAYWVAIEFLVARLSPNATFGSIAYSQMDFLPVVQIAAVCGISGISFVLLLFPAAIAVLLAPGATSVSRWQTGAIAASLLGLALGYGVLRLHDTPATYASVPVGFAVFDDAPARPAASRAAGQRILDFYADAMTQLATRGAKFGLTPETIVAANDAEFADLAQRFGALASTQHINIVMGIERIGGNVEHNASYLFRAAGGEPLEYFKHHLVPGFEDRYTPGTQTQMLLDNVAPIALVVCKDMDFPALSRDYGRQGAALMLAPAWDFDSDGWLHDRMAILRGVESGFALARAARDGRVSASDNRGRVLAEIDDVNVPKTVLMADLPLQHIDTIYMRFGDWFAWLCVAVLALLLALRALAPRARET